MEEKTRILKMVADGTVTPEQAEQLLEALEADTGESALTPAFSAGEYDRKLLKIVVDSADGDKIRVQFPIKGIKDILRATGKLPINIDGMEGVDMSEMMEAVTGCLDSQVVGDFVTVESADSSYIRIYVE